MPLTTVPPLLRREALINTMSDSSEPSSPVKGKPRRARTLGALTPEIVGPAFSKRGFAGADLALHWPEIVGAGVARYSRPLDLKWPKGGPDSGAGATLTVASTGAFALDLQQMAPVILERINRRLGWRCVTRIAIRQMPVRPPQPAPPRFSLQPEDIAQASRIAAGIEADSLRDAMSRLGAGIIARCRQQRLTKP